MASFYDFNVTPYTWHKVNQHCVQYYVIDNDFLISLNDKINCYTFKIKKGARSAKRPRDAY